MKTWSKYNFLFKGNRSYYIYNSLSNALAEISSEDFFELQQVSVSSPNQVVRDSLLQQLKPLKAFVDSDDGEINKIRYRSRVQRSSDVKLELTINPTLACNFNCPYCFEKQHPNIYMTDEVEEQIIEYIKRHKQAKFLHVTWFGGEPLLAYRRIVTLTERMKELGLYYSANMITNGYLLNQEIIDNLSYLAISSIQITIDGLAERHNSRRGLKSGGETYDRILQNIALLSERQPKIRIGVRVNVDKSNKDDFISICNFFREKRYPNLSVSLSFVQDLANTENYTQILSRDEQAEFVLYLLKQHSLEFGHIYPSSKRYECAIRNRNAIVIGPEGELYKCWNDVGDASKVFGHLGRSISNEKLLLRYLVGSDPFEDPRCQECILLPVCGGGCPYSRLQRDTHHPNINVCPLIKDHLERFLLAHITHRHSLTKKIAKNKPRITR